MELIRKLAVNGFSSSGSGAIARVAFALAVPTILALTLPTVLADWFLVPTEVPAPVIGFATGACIAGVSLWGWLLVLNTLSRDENIALGCAVALAVTTVVYGEFDRSVFGIRGTGTLLYWAACVATIAAYGFLVARFANGVTRESEQVVVHEVAKGQWVIHMRSHALERDGEGRTRFSTLNAAIRQAGQWHPDLDVEVRPLSESNG